MRRMKGMAAPTLAVAAGRGQNRAYNEGEPMKKLALALLLLLVLGVGWMAWAPAVIEPRAWTPPPAPALAGPYAPNERLKDIEKLALDAGQGPEGVSLDVQRRVIAGYADGRIVRLDPASDRIEELANTGGRPLGTAVAADGTIFIADAVKGLMELAPSGALRVLSGELEGAAYRFVDDVAVSADGAQLYFTDASARFGLHHVMEDFLEHAGSGRVLRYDRSSGRVTVLLDGLFFPNGVALGPKDEYLLINETQTYRILRYWLQGPKAGTQDVLIENLPGLPDNLSFNGRDRFWVALYSPRVPAMDSLLPHPWLRKILIRLPESTRPKPAMKAFVLGLDLDGRVVENLQYEGPGAYAPITSVEQQDGSLYFGSLSYPAIGRLRMENGAKAGP
jgi:sugar lactone lactonase YvrE